MTKYLAIYFCFLSLGFAMEDREPDSAPLEPPYISEEEWEARQADTQPVQKENQEYEVVEENEDYIKVRHPEAKNGLKRILADGTYIYEREKSEVNSYSGFKIGTQKFENLSNNTTNKNFDDVYKTTYTLYLDYEKPIFSKDGNLKWNYGVNLVYATGNGFFATGAEASETYSLFMIPIHGGVTYHFQYFGETQTFVPYISAGIDAFFVMENRDDGESVRTYTGGAHANGGLRILMDKWMGDMADLDEDYGINHAWLTLDFKYIIGAENGQTGSDVVDITSSVVSIGFGFDI